MIPCCFQPFPKANDPSKPSYFASFLKYWLSLENVCTPSTPSSMHCWNPMLKFWNPRVNTADGKGYTFMNSKRVSMSWRDVWRFDSVLVYTNELHAWIYQKCLKENMKPVTSLIRRDKKNNVRRKTHSYEDVWGTSQGVFNGDLLSSSRIPFSKPTPKPPENALQKNPEGVTRTVRSLAGLSCFFAFLLGDFVASSPKMAMKIPWLNSSNVYGYLPKPDGDFLMLQKKDPGGVRQPTFSNKMAGEWPVLFQIPDTVGNCLSQKSHLEVKKSLSITLWLYFGCSSAWMLAPNHQPSAIGYERLRRIISTALIARDALPKTWRAFICWSYSTSVGAKWEAEREFWNTKCCG